jgi:hypothetical protein
MPISEILDGVWAEGTAVMNHSNATTNVHGAGANSLEQTGNKNIVNGYVGLDAAGLIPSTLGAELTANKDTPNGYPGIDSSMFLPADRIGYTSLIPIGVHAEEYGFAIPGYPYKTVPYIDDTPTYYNLIFVANGHYIGYEDLLQCFYMRII